MASSRCQLRRVMHDFAGHLARDVARELNIPSKTVYSRLATARLRFVMNARALSMIPDTDCDCDCD